MPAPVFVSVYDRPDHFRACIDSLARNKLAEETVLYISSDGPADDASAAKVGQVREYIKSITGFKKVFPFLPRENTQGEIRFRAFDEVRSNHKTYINTEDDNVFSPFALTFLNEGLERYKHDKRVHAVCAYMYPGFPSKNTEQVYLRCVAGWGIGLWRDRDLRPDFDQRTLALEALCDKSLFTKTNNSLPHLAPMNKAIVEGRLRAGDVTRCNYLFKFGGIAVFPSVSLVRNIGNDGSGMHCGIDRRYATQTISQQKIEFNQAKPMRVLRGDEFWISQHFGGRKKAFRNKVIHHECKGSPLLVTSFYRLANTLLSKSSLPVVRIIRGPIRWLKRSFAR